MRLVPQPPSQPMIGQNEAGTLNANYPTPLYTDTQLLALIENNVQDYLALPYGTPPPENTDPDKLLVQQVSIDWKVVKRLYASDRANQDTYNASISYVEEAASCPIFSRDYIIRRANYPALALARGSVLAGIVNATVTAAGINYLQSTTTVSLSGGTGSGGQVGAVVSDGKIVHLYIVQEGNYTVAPTLTINGAGSGATGTCAVQLQTAYLVKEDMLRQQESPLDSLYVLVRRSYMTLPGPVVTSYEEDPETFALVTITRQKVLGSTVSPSAGVGGSSVTYQAIDSVVTLKTVRSIGTSLPQRNEWRTIEFSFPRRVYSVTGTLVEARDGQAVVNINAVARGGMRKRVLVRTLISYLTTAGVTTPTDPQNWPVRDMVFNGPFFSVNEREVLNDSFEVTFTTGTDNPLWPEIEEDVSFSASNLSASQYDALIGAEILIGDTIEVWNKYNLYRSVQTYTKVLE